MKKFNIKSMNRKTFFLSLVLLIAVVGVGITVALSVARTDPVVNSFEVGKIDTSIVETVDSDLNKSVKVKNASRPAATSDAFIRVRLNAPEGVTLVLNSGWQTYWYDGNDGFYYFKYSVAPGESTEELLSQVNVDATALDELKKTGFDVTVYHESCIATTERHVGEGDALYLDEIKTAFNNATATTPTLIPTE